MRSLWLIVESFRDLVWRCCAGKRDPHSVSEPVSTSQPWADVVPNWPLKVVTSPVTSPLSNKTSYTGATNWQPNVGEADGLPSAGKQGGDRLAVFSLRRALKCIHGTYAILLNIQLRERRIIRQNSCTLSTYLVNVQHRVRVVCIACTVQLRLTHGAFC